MNEIIFNDSSSFSFHKNIFPQRSAEHNELTTTVEIFGQKRKLFSQWLKSQLSD